VSCRISLRESSVLNSELLYDADGAGGGGGGAMPMYDGALYGAEARHGSDDTGGYDDVGGP
jgi:hypothetical protein